MLLTVDAYVVSELNSRLHWGLLLSFQLHMTANAIREHISWHHKLAMTPMQCNAMMIFIKAVVKSRSCWVDFTDEAFRFLPIHLEQRQKWQSADSIRCMVYWENIILDGCSYKWGQVWMGWVSSRGILVIRLLLLLTLLIQNLCFEQTGCYIYK